MLYFIRRTESDSSIDYYSSSPISTQKESAFHSRNSPTPSDTPKSPSPSRPHLSKSKNKKKEYEPPHATIVEDNDVLRTTGKSSSGSPVKMPKSSLNTLSESDLLLDSPSKSRSPTRLAKLKLSPEEHIRRSRQNALQRFESKLNNTEEIFRKAEKIRKKSRREIAKKNLTLDRKIQMNSPIEISSFADMLWKSNEKNINSVLDMTNKQSKASDNWVRKLEIVGGIKPNVSSNKVKDVTMAKRLLHEAGKMKRDRKEEDNRLMHRSMFGVYSAKEVINLLKTFNTLVRRERFIELTEDEKEMIEKKRGEIVEERKILREKEAKRREEAIAAAAAAAAAKDDSEMDLELQILLGLAQPEPEITGSEEEANVEYEDEDIAIQREEEALRRQKALSFKATDDEVLIIDLMKTRFVAHRPHFINQLSHLLQKSALEGIKQDVVYITLKDALIALCPFLSVNERNDCLRFLNIQQKILHPPEDGPIVIER